MKAMYLKRKTLKKKKLTLTLTECLLFAKDFKSGFFVLTH